MLKLWRLHGKSLWLLTAGVFAALAFSACAQLGQPGAAFVGVWQPDEESMRGYVLEIVAGKDEAVLTALAYAENDRVDAKQASGALSADGKTLELTYRNELEAVLHIDAATGKLVYVEPDGGDSYTFTRRAAH